MAHKILLVTPFFPPVFRSATLRFLRLYSYLWRFGWEPYVLTVDPKSCRLGIALDESLLGTLDPPLNPHYVVRVPEHWVPVQAFMPGYQPGWMPHAIWVGFRLVRTHGIDLIFGSYGPPSSLLTAFAIASIAHKPFVADFRDGWALDKKILLQKAGCRVYLELFLERIIIHRADLLTFVTEELKDAYISEYGIPKNKTLVLPNGWDRRLLKVLLSNGTGMLPQRKLTFVYAGTFYGSRNPYSFLQALWSLVKSGEINREDIALTFVTDHRSKSLLHIPSGMEDLVEVIGPLSYRETLRVIARSTVALLITHNKESKWVCPAKLFDYMALGKPVFAITSDPVPIALLKSYHAGFIANPNNPSSIREQLLLVYDLWSQNALYSPNNEILEQFEATKLVADFAHALETLVSNVREEL